VEQEQQVVHGNPGSGGAGGTGLANSITGSPVTYAGGGGGGAQAEVEELEQVEVEERGGSGANHQGFNAGTANTGGGGGGTGSWRWKWNGGSGIVIVRAKSSTILFSASPGTNTVTTVCGQDIATFTVPGNLSFTKGPAREPVDYLVVAGGGGGGCISGFGGGGAGGYSTSFPGGTKLLNSWNLSSYSWRRWSWRTMSAAAQEQIQFFNNYISRWRSSKVQLLTGSMEDQEEEQIFRSRNNWKQEIHHQ
jgi:hypothetical protein